MALAYTLTRPGVTSLVVGARRVDQLVDNLGSAELVLADEAVERIERVSRPILPYPYWHQMSWIVDRFGPAERPFRTPNIT